MPIKSFTFAFKLDAKDLLEYVVNKNIQVDIHATGQRLPAVDPLPLPAPEQPLALPAPKNNRNMAENSRGAVLLFMAQHPQENHSVAVIRALLEQIGYSGKSSNGLLNGLLNAGLIKKSTSAKGGWRISAKGLRKAEELEV